MLNETEDNIPQSEQVIARDITADALADVGLETHVYARPIQAREVLEELAGQLDVPPETWLYSVHAANGVRVAVVDSREAAFQGARAYGYEPLSVH